MKKFVVCNSSKKHFKQTELHEGEEHLIIYCKDLKTVFEAWSELDSSVKKVTINVFTEDPTFTINPFHLNLEINTNIREISFNCYTHDIWLKFILDTCPNLETLYFYKLTKDKLKYAAENLEHLKHMYCDYIEDDASEFYKKFKSTEKDINKNIKIN
ncbi:CLUMA_CG015224, isoform A [Clunio marinus]|uniref:CLUMA_CG015224, isoform A n=1 Tax=Clunio marinus TaxID=568069 RepID=A0A1J1INY8_9DIPT|nr:CLUMA_CG015224, isoform A [Clunio marinus]